MNFIDVVRKRRSCRKFLNKDVTKDIIEQLVDAARLAPTARNVQPWEFIAVRDKKLLAKLASLCPNGMFLQEAGACVIVCCHDTKYYLEDGVAATENILLAVCALGLGACWIAGDKKDYCTEIQKIFKIPENVKIVSMIAIGYSNEPGQGIVPKRELKEVLHWEQY